MASNEPASPCRAYSPSAPQARPEIFAPLLIALAVFVANLPVLQASFLFDDYRYFVNAPRINTMHGLMQALTDNTRPLLFLSLGLDSLLHEFDARWFHLTNLLILCVQSMLLFAIARRCLPALCAEPLPRAGASTPARSAVWAAGAAMFWGLHPLQTNLTGYIWQRGEMLMALGVLLALYCFQRAQAAHARSRAWLLLSVGCCLAGMLCKEPAALAPLLILLYDRAFAAGSLARAMRLRYWYYAGLAVVWGVFAWLLWRNAPGFHQNTGVGFHSSAYTPWQYAATMPGVIAHYLRLALVPVGLCFDPNWPIARTTADVLVPLCLVGPLLGLTLAALLRRPRTGFWAAWFFLLLAPTSSVMPMPDPMFEYRLHLPLAGVAVLLATAAARSAARVASAFPARVGPLRFVAAACACMLLALFGLLTWRRAGDYRTEVSIWRKTFAQRPNNIRAFSNLWLALKKRRRMGEAEAAYRRILQRDPARTDASLFLGCLAQERGDLQTAERLLVHTVATDPRAFIAVYHLGEIAEARSRERAALACYLRALQLRPLFVLADFSAARIYARTGHPQKALVHYRRAVRISPRWAEAHAYLGRLLLCLGRRGQALKHLRAAVKLAPAKRAFREWLEAARRPPEGERQ